LLYAGTWLCCFAFGLLLNLLGLLVVTVGVSVLVYRLIRREDTHPTATRVEADWKRGLLSGAHLWIAALALVVLALSLKESLFFAVLSGALVVRIASAFRKVRVAAKT
jgi:hypothetical protein